jgi:alkylated DNA repair dioxygenase AlkB
MDLFCADPRINLLPCDGIVNYHGPVVSGREASSYFEALNVTVEWRPDEVVLFGKRIVTARKVACYGDSDYAYNYSGGRCVALSWTRELHQLRGLLEEMTAEKFNSCLCNLYHSGAEGMGWHSDDEDAIGRDTAIASLSFGAERKFCLRHKRRKDLKPITLQLEDGGLLIMKGATQKNWQHSVPKAARITMPRINLTFRSIVRAGSSENSN